MKKVHSVAIVVLIVAVIATVSVTVASQNNNKVDDEPAQSQNSFEVIANGDVSSVSDEDSLMKIIDAWLQENNLNMFGDPMDTVYMGGSPLFDMTTGTSVSRFSYLMEKFQDQPWIRV